MNMQILLSDEKLIALVEGMLASLKEWKGASKCSQGPVNNKKIDITGTWLEKELQDKGVGGGGQVFCHPHNNDDLYRSRKQYRKRELKQHAKLMQIK